jgi:hypothetical protein
MLEEPCTALAKTHAPGEVIGWVHLPPRSRSALAAHPMTSLAAVTSAIAMVRPGTES